MGDNDDTRIHELAQQLQDKCHSIREITFVHDQRRGSGLDVELENTTPLVQHDILREINRSDCWIYQIHNYPPRIVVFEIGTLEQHYSYEEHLRESEPRPEQSEGT